MLRIRAFLNFKYKKILRNYEYYFFHNDYLFIKNYNLLILFINIIRNKEKE